MVKLFSSDKFRIVNSEVVAFTCDVTRVLSPIFVFIMIIMIAQSNTSYILVFHLNQSMHASNCREYICASQHQGQKLQRCYLSVLHGHLITSMRLRFWLHKDCKTSMFNTSVLSSVSQSVIISQRWTDERILGKLQFSLLRNKVFAGRADCPTSFLVGSSILYFLLA